MELKISETQDLGCEILADNLFDGDLEEDYLIKLAKNGDKKANDILIKKYYWLVESKASKFYMNSGERDDIIQEGLIGLFKAIKSYKVNEKASFSTFADLCIKRQIITAINKETTKKNIPLYNYISINNFFNKDFKEFNYEKFNLNKEVETSDPEDILIIEEKIFEIKSKIKKYLSSYEIQVLDLYLKGKSYKEIGISLGQTSKSVDNAIQRIRKKLMNKENK